MRRLRDRQQAHLFRGGELPRLMTMVVMLLVLGMLYRRASDHNTWRFLTGEPASIGTLDDDSTGSRPRSTPHAPIRRPGSVVVTAPETDADLMLAFEHKTVRPASGPDLTAAPSAETTTSAETPPSALVASAATDPEPPAAVAEPTEVAQAEPAQDQPPAAQSPAVDDPASASSVEPVAPPASTSEPSDQPAAAPAAEAPAAKESPTTREAPATKDSSAAGAGPAAADAQGSAAPAADAGDKKPSEPVAPVLPKPLFRPHLPAAPDNVLDPNQEPARPELEPNPLDEDPQERQQFDREAEAISDRTPLGEEEMFAYWRLMRWAQSQNADQLVKRARGDFRYGDLLERPQEFRGDLLKVNVHIRRILRYDSPPGIPVDAHEYYEAVCWTEATQSWLYTCVFVDLPEGMKVGDFLQEEGTFVGYFLKTYVYLDGRGIKVKSPILIGRMIYRQAPAITQSKDEWIWGAAVGGGLLLLFFARWGLRSIGKSGTNPPVRRVLQRGPLADEPSEGQNIEEWLQQAEAQTREAEIKSALGHDFNGSRAGDGASLLGDLEQGNAGRNEP